MIRFDVFTILPDVMESYLAASMVGRARLGGQVVIGLHNVRDYTHDRHRTTDDTPYGGGGGMVMKPEPIFEAVESVLGEDFGQVPIVLLSPQGRVFTQATAREWSRQPRLALICGRYEGVDERVRGHLATDEVSIGDYVLTGGELPALVVVDSIVRLLPGVLGDAGGPDDDSHAHGLLEYPHYTRPPNYRGWGIPEVLLSGDHARIAAWRRDQSLLRTSRRRPDLLDAADLTPEERDRLSTRARAADEPADAPSS
jgi:tRNA (guanine37-N1)-methyltransferase